MKQEVNETVESVEERKERGIDFVESLMILSRGSFIIDCGRQLDDVTDAVAETNKAGEIVITLKIEPSGWDKATRKPNQVDVIPTVKIKRPLADQGKSIFFLNKDNKLTRKDPNQEDLFGE